MPVRCISIGPRSDGRDYGLLPRFRELRVSDRAGAVLGDFALALLQWGQSGGPDFALFFALDETQSVHLLARAAHLRSESLGPVVIANGFLIDAETMNRIEWRPHRLLPALRSPREGEWDRLEIEAELASPRPKGGALSEIGAALPHFDRQVLVAVADNGDTVEVASEILDSAPNFAGLYPAWTLAGDLPRVERFEPSRFELVVAGEAVIGAKAGAFRVAGAHVSGPPLPRSPGWQIWQTLFAATLDDDRGALQAAAAHAPRGNLADGSSAIAASMHAVLNHRRSDQAGPWALLSRWAAAAAFMTGGEGVQAEAAVATVVREMLEHQPDQVAKAALLSFYMRDIAPKLQRAPTMLAAGIASTHGLIPLLEPDDLRRLLEPGLSRALASALVQQELPGAAARPERLGIVADALRRVVVGKAAAEVRTLAERVLAEAAVALRRKPADPRQLQQLGDRALHIAEDLLLSAASGWRRLAPLVAELSHSAPASEARRALMSRLRAAPGTFWSRPHDLAARRLTSVTLRLLHSARGAA